MDKWELRKRIAQLIEDTPGDDRADDDYDYWLPVVDKILDLIKESEVQFI